MTTTSPTLTARLNYSKSAPGVYQAMDAHEQYLATCSIERPLLLMVQLRASQLNGCAYCIDAHWKDLRALGESEHRLYSLPVWDEVSLYSERERAALRWTEAVTLLADDRVPDAVYESVGPHFSDRELADLTFAIASMNSWNRLSVAARLVPGT